jgi:hypothetical protein
MGEDHPRQFVKAKLVFDGYHGLMAKERRGLSLLRGGCSRI